MAVNIEGIERQMREARAAGRDCVVVGSDGQAFRIPPEARGLWRREDFNYHRTINGRVANVHVVPEASTSLPGRCLARKLRFEQRRFDREPQAVTVVFADPVNITAGAITREVNVKGSRRTIAFDPFLPFDGSRGARIEMRNFGAHVEKNNKKR